MGQRAGCGQEALGHILGIEPRLKGVAGDAQVLLRGGQAFPGGHAKLPFHQIDAGDRLADRVLDLQPGIHFHEPEPVSPQPFGGIDDEFHRARPLVANRLGGAHGGGTHGFAHLFGHARRRGFFDHFLMPPLQRAIALEEMHRAGAIAKDLHLDVARFGDVFLHQHIVIAKGCPGLGLGRFQRADKTGRVLDQPHPLATAPGHGLDQHRIADGLRFDLQMPRILIGAVISGHHRHARFLHQMFGRRFQAHGADGARRGADKDQPCRFDHIHEIGVFGEEAIAGVNGLRTCRLGRRNDRVAAQIAFCRGRSADMHRRIGQRDMACARVRVRIHSDAAQAHRFGRLHHAGGNLAPIGNQDRVKHQRCPLVARMDRGLPAPGPPGVFRAK